MNEHPKPGVWILEFKIFKYIQKNWKPRIYDTNGNFIYVNFMHNGSTEKILILKNKNHPSVHDRQIYECKKIFKWHFSRYKGFNMFISCTA